MISPREILEGYRETIDHLDKVLLRDDLDPMARKGFERLRDDAVWFVSHICEEDCV